MNDNNTDTHQEEQYTRQVHSSLGGSKEFLRGFTLKEITLMLSPVAISVTVAAFLPPFLVWAMLGVGVFGSIVALFLYKMMKPAYLTLDEYILNKLMWAIKAPMSHLGDESDTTRFMHRVDSIEQTALRRLDNTLVGAVRIEPANMALQNASTWARATRSFGNFCSTALDFDSQIYITSKPINPDNHLRQLEQRLDDDDVKNNGKLNALIQGFMSWYRNRLNTDGANTREFYILVTVSDYEIQKPGATDDSALSGLAELPIIGRVFAKFEKRQEGLTDTERERLKRDKLEHRLEKVRTGASGIYGCNGSVIPTEELALLVKEYWSTEEQHYAELDKAFADKPVTITEKEEEHHGVVDGVTYSDDVLDDIESEVQEEYNLDEDDEQATKEATEHKVAQKLTDTKRKHKGILAPSNIEWHENYCVINGDTYVQTMWLEAFPEQPSDGFLERVLLETGEGVDVSVHLDPFDTSSATDALEDWISNLQVTLDEMAEQGEIRAEDLQQDIQRAKMIRDSVRNNKTGMFRAGVFIRIVANSEDELFSRSRTVRSILKDVPANTTPQVATRWQEKGLVTVSPVGKNALGDNRMSTMTGSAVGAMFPFSSDYYMNNSGIEYGVHGHNGSPVIIDAFDLDTGHNELVAGDIGSGKTYGINKRILRTKKQDPDTNIVMLDPVEGFRNVADTFDANKIVVGGSTQLNPLHIEPTPQEVLDAADGELEPFKAKLDEVMGFFGNYFAMEDHDLGNARGVLRHAIKRVYADAGITSDVETHSKQSPTIADLIEVITEIAENPEEYDIATAKASQDKVRDWATDLEVALQPFKDGGVYDNLAGESDLDILSTDNDGGEMVYIDLQQEEGRGDSNKAFLMQLLLSTVYQQAKKTDENTMLVIDEAHYLLKNKDNLGYITQIVRHSRHVDMRLVFASQTLDEFYANEDAKTITSQCSIKMLHKLSGLDKEIAEELGLTENQYDFVKNASAGDEELGYSEALVSVKEKGEYPLQVRSDPLEHEVITQGENGEHMSQIMEPDHETSLADLGVFLEQNASTEHLQEEYGYSEKQAEQLVNAASSGNVLGALKNTLDTNNASAEEPQEEARTDNNHDSDMEEE